jgi:hypothetical protein
LPSLELLRLLLLRGCGGAETESCACLLQSPVPRKVVDFGMFTSQLRVEVYPIKLKLKLYDPMAKDDSDDDSSDEEDENNDSAADDGSPPKPKRPKTFKHAFSREAPLGTSPPFTSTHLMLALATNLSH